MFVDVQLNTALVATVFESKDSVELGAEVMVDEVVEY